ncbi:MAG: MFS transporter [Acidobacteriia bacterium]|nr:MFS transporter [Terriglobia bacterium]
MSSQRPARLLWVMFFAYFTFGLSGVFGALIPDIIREFHLSRSVAALFGSALFVSVALFAIPSGLLADRIGARKVILGGVALMAVGCFLVSQSHNYPLILAMVFAVGIGITMLQTTGSPLVQDLDVKPNYPRNLNFTIACATFGGFLAIFILAYIRGTGRAWQWYYVVFALICLTLLGMFLLSRFPPRAGNAERIRLDQIGKLLRNPILLTYGIGTHIYTVGEVGTYMWIPKFFEDVHGVPAIASNAAAATFMGRVFPSLPALIYALFLGMQGLGRLVGGAVLNRFGSRRIMRIYSVLTLLSLLVAIFGSKYVTAVAFAACGFFMSVLYPLIFSGTINSFSEHHGTISGLLCTAYISAALLSPFQGWMADHFGMRTAMVIPVLCMTYVIGLALFGRAKYD